MAQTDYFLRSTFATVTGDRSMVRTLRAAAVQKVRPVMQCWPLQLPSAFCIVLRLSVIGCRTWAVGSALLEEALADVQVAEELLAAVGAETGDEALVVELGDDSSRRASPSSASLSSNE